MLELLPRLIQLDLDKAMHIVTAGLGVLMIAANVEEKGFYVIVDVTVVLHAIINNPLSITIMG